jgi:hypothetical protein
MLGLAYDITEPIPPHHIIIIAFWQSLRDASRAWDWKTAYEACEAATVLFLRKFGPAIRAKPSSPASMLPLLARIANLLPTHTRRSEKSQAFQQFSTPIALGLVAVTAAAITPTDLVLEPSPGTGLLAILAELSGGSLVLNELAKTRAGLLGHLFPRLLSPSSMARRSTTISTPASIRALC